MGYRYAAVNNEIDEEENYLLDDKIPTFKMDVSDIKDVLFDKVIPKVEKC